MDKQRALDVLRMFAKYRDRIDWNDPAEVRQILGEALDAAGIATAPEPTERWARIPF